MKILIISDAWHPQVNGVVRTYEHLISELEKMGHAVSVIGPKDFPITIPLLGYSEIKLALFSGPKIKKLIQSYAPDTIHIATEGPLGVSAQKYCLNNNMPFSTSYHTQFPEYLKKRVEKIAPFIASYAYRRAVQKIIRFHNNATSLLVSTKSIKSQLEDWGIKTPMHLFTRGVNNETFNLENAKSPYNDLPKPVALYVGRIAIEKNIENFLDMPWQGTKVIVGQGPDKEKLRAKYPNIVFTGKRMGQELAAYYKNADVFVFPSRTDTFGMVLVEALACGLPIAAYPVTGPKDIVTKDYLGCLDNDLGVAADKAVNENNKEKRAEYIKTHYTWKKAADQFIKASPLNDKKANS